MLVRLGQHYHYRQLSAIDVKNDRLTISPPRRYADQAASTALGATPRAGGAHRVSGRGLRAGKIMLGLHLVGDGATLVTSTVAVLKVLPNGLVRGVMTRSIFILLP